MIAILIDSEGRIHSISSSDFTRCGINNSSGKIIRGAVKTHMTRLCKICFSETWERYK